MVVTDALVASGYRVLEACHAAEALEILSARGDIDMLITDVRMPGEMDGIALAWEAAARIPGAAVIVTSGHAQPAPGDLPEGAMFIGKPYWPRALTALVAGALAARGERRQTLNPVASAIAPTPAAVTDETLQVVADEHAAREREADGDAEA